MEPSLDHGRLELATRMRNEYILVDSLLHSVSSTPCYIWQNSMENTREFVSGTLLTARDGSVSTVAI